MFQGTASKIIYKVPKFHLVWDLICALSSCEVVHID